MKKVLVTGASSGIGKSMVGVFFEKGWQVLALARREDKLNKLREEYKGIQSLVCDLSDPSAIKSLKSKISSPIHALVNNAGIYHPCSVDEDEDQVWQDHYNTNLMGPVRLTRLLWPLLKESHGSIINISSTLAIKPISGTSAYSALKSAMNNWTLSLALEGAPYRIKANVICPGIVDTPIHSYYREEGPRDKTYYESLQKSQPLGRTGRPEDIAFMTEQLCRPESQWITGSIITIDGGLSLV